MASKDAIPIVKEPKEPPRGRCLGSPCLLPACHLSVTRSGYHIKSYLLATCWRLGFNEAVLPTHLV